MLIRLIKTQMIVDNRLGKNDIKSICFTGDVKILKYVYIFVKIKMLHS